VTTVVRYREIDTRLSKRERERQREADRKEQSVIRNEDDEGR